MDGTCCRHEQNFLDITRHILTVLGGAAMYKHVLKAVQPICRGVANARHRQ